MTALIGHAQTVIAVTESAKVGKVTFARICDIEHIDELVTDSEADRPSSPPSRRQACGSRSSSRLHGLSSDRRESSPAHRGSPAGLPPPPYAW